MTARLVECVRSFFSATTHPVNLAVFRAVVFYRLMYEVRSTYLSMYAVLPKGMRVPPEGYDLFFDYIPISEPWTFWLRYVAYGFAFFSAIGLFSRTSTKLAVITSLYVIGVRHCFGKIDHNCHPLIWFAALLAVSPCGDALSLDALIRWCRGKLRGSVLETARPARVYALPLRFVWILFGVIYFFPGIAKLAQGPEWYISDNLRHIMYAKWFSQETLPVFRIDQLPILCRGAALGAILFEISFIFLIFSRRLRPLAMALGICFHLGTRLFLYIRYTSLLVCYVAFIDWFSLFRRTFGRLLRLYPKARDKLATTPSADHRRSERRIIFVGSLLIAVNSFCAVTRVNSWPFSRMPDFRNVRREAVVTTHEYMITKIGSEPRKVKPWMPLWNALEYRPRRAERQTQTARLARWNAVVEMMIYYGLELEGDEELQIYEVVRSSVPEERDRPPLQRQLVFEYRRT